MSTSSDSGSKDLLNSWKEIAAYLQRGVRTVQRWESEFGLPVRRPAGKGRSAVIAMRSDLDDWLKSCSISQNGSAPARMEWTNGSGRRAHTHETHMRTKNAIEICAALQVEMVRTCDEVRQAVERYIVTVRSIKLPPPAFPFSQTEPERNPEEL